MLNPKIASSIDEEFSEKARQKMKDPKIFEGW